MHNEYKRIPPPPLSLPRNPRSRFQLFRVFLSLKLASVYMWNKFYASAGIFYWFWIHIQLIVIRKERKEAEERRECERSSSFTRELLVHRHTFRCFVNPIMHTSHISWLPLLTLNILVSLNDAIHKPCLRIREKHTWVEAFFRQCYVCLNIQLTYISSPVLPA